MLFCVPLAILATVFILCVDVAILATVFLVCWCGPALALERFPVRNGQRWFPNALKEFKKN